jgi:hypothetical protein
VHYDTQIIQGSASFQRMHKLTNSHQNEGKIGKLLNFFGRPDTVVKIILCVPTPTNHNISKCPIQEYTALPFYGIYHTM